VVLEVGERDRWVSHFLGIGSGKFKRLGKDCLLLAEAGDLGLGLTATELEQSILEKGEYLLGSAFGLLFDFVHINMNVESSEGPPIFLFWNYGREKTNSGV